MIWTFWIVKNENEAKLIRLDPIMLSCANAERALGIFIKRAMQRHCEQN
jgi:hypothetical protein